MIMQDWEGGVPFQQIHHDAAQEMATSTRSQPTIREVLVISQYFYTFDYMLAQSTEWRDELWDRYQNASEGSVKAWYYRCWQDFNSAAAGLQRLIEVSGEEQVPKGPTNL